HPEFHHPNPACADEWSQITFVPGIAWPLFRFRRLLNLQYLDTIKARRSFDKMRYWMHNACTLV
ncbi:MAG: hypothetical protein PHN46_10190, partial [Eubacteriales bacterium]|nr:hypothetical protein [Eubacteriales bacterium]